jgi:hypothetical protein
MSELIVLVYEHCTGHAFLYSKIRIAEIVREGSRRRRQATSGPFTATIEIGAERSTSVDPENADVQLAAEFAEAVTLAEAIIDKVMSEGLTSSQIVVTKTVVVDIPTPVVTKEHVAVDSNVVQEDNGTPIAVTQQAEAAAALEASQTEKSVEVPHALIPSSIFQITSTLKVCTKMHYYLFAFFDLLFV